MYYNNTCKRLRVIFVFKQFPIGLKQNLREEDNLSTRDKWPVPKVSSVRRFYCKTNMHVSQRNLRHVSDIACDGLDVKGMVTSNWL